MSKIFIRSKHLAILFIGFSLLIHSFVYASEQSVTLLWTVYHHRNQDRIAVILNQSDIQLAVNTSSFQKMNKTTRLGLFQSTITPQLKLFKEQVLHIYNRLQNMAPLSSVIKINKKFQSQSKFDLYAPIIYINKQKVKQDHFYFKTLENLIYKIWEHKWKCVNCAFYKKGNSFIQRTLYNPTSVPEQKSGKKPPLQWNKQKKKFSKKQLNCITQGKKKIECVDPNFGIFKI